MLVCGSTGRWCSSRRSRGASGPRRGQRYTLKVGWDTDVEELWALYRLVSAEARLDLRAMRVDGRIVALGSSASFSVVRRRVVVDWSDGLPTPMLLLDFLSGDLTDDEVWGAYASLTVAVDQAAWRDVRRTVREAIDRWDV